MDFFVVANSLTLGRIAFVPNSTWELIVCRFTQVSYVRSTSLLRSSHLKQTSLAGISRSLLQKPLVPCALCQPCSSFSSPRAPLGALYFLFVRVGFLPVLLPVICLLRDAARCAGLPYHSFKGHSFRIGAASTAVAADLPDWLIKVLGRWSSDYYQLYIRTPQQIMLSAAPRMAGVSGLDSFT